METSVTETTVLVVGGGPHSLALLSALHEKSFAFPQFSQTEVHKRVGFGGASAKIGSVCVLDPGEAFLAEWHKRFDALEIQHLRSPAFAHPRAFEPQALVHFAVRTGRVDELHHVPDGIGRRLATSDFSSQEPLLFGLPSTALFKDFCAELAKELPHTWLRGRATHVHKDDASGKFRVQYVGHDGELALVIADAVVLATGPAGQHNVPPPFVPLVGSGSVVHTDELLRKGSLRDVIECSSDKHVLVIGGGLTAAQAALAVSALGARVTLRSRRPLQTRAYDISADWLDGRHTNRLRFEFLNTHPAERAQYVKRAVSGGSVPETYMRQLHELASTTELLELQTDAELDQRTVSLLPNGKVRVDADEFDSVILATGAANQPMCLPLFEQVAAEFGAPTLGGLPHVDEALRWVPGEDLFVVGANAALELGPGALNLMGAMRGAQIVSAELRDSMYAARARPSAATATNRYSALLIDDSDDDEGGDDEEDDSDDNGDGSSTTTDDASCDIVGESESESDSQSTAGSSSDASSGVM